MTPFSREFNRVLLGLLTVLALITLSAAYWAMFGPERLLRREDNPRLVEDQARILRGAIVDRSDRILAETRLNENQITTRYYLEPAAYSLTGYYSLRYGSSLTEAAYNDFLSGNNIHRSLGRQFEQDVLHLPQMGSDVRLTIDRDVQVALADALADTKGAGVVLSVPSGEVLASVSVPTYDPNTLNANWDQLVEDPGDPFYNRAIQGGYQPGGMLYLPLLISGIMYNVDLEESYTNARQPVIFEDVSLVCHRNTIRTRMTLIQAFRYGCPAPFAALIERLGEDKISEGFNFFNFNAPSRLAGYLPGGEDELPETMPELTGELLAITSTYPFVETALGQGDIVVSPLHLATLVAAVINGGNAPQPHTLLATRLPESETWEPVDANLSAQPIMTQQTARTIAEIMQTTTTNYGLRMDSYDLGIYTALAYSGDSTLTWFAGFARSTTGQSVVAVLIIEDSSDLSRIADEGLQILQQAIAVQ